MKKILLFVASWLLLSMAFSQSKEDLVRDYVLQAYPESEEVDVAQEGGGYTAAFYDGIVLKTAVFDKSGEWQYTQSVVTEDAIDPSELSQVKKEYPGGIIHQIFKMELQKYYYYQIQMTVDDAGQELKVDAMGSILSVTPMSFVDETED